MKKVIVDANFWEVSPGAIIEILSASDVDNHVIEETEETYHQLLNSAAKEARNYLTEETFSQNEITAQWRQVFTIFKTRKGARSPTEALLKRVDQERELFLINPLVDIYNSISLSFGVPCGGEDIEKISENLHLGKAQGGESLLPLGADSDAPALSEEIICYDEQGAICRCLSWCGTQRTMLTEETQAAVLIVESINAEQAARGVQAIEASKEKIDQTFGASSVRHTLTRVGPEAEL